MSTRWSAVLGLLLVGCDQKPAPEPARELGPQPAAELPCHAVGKAFMSDVTSGRFEQAYARTCAPYRASVSLLHFTAGAKSHPYLQPGQGLSGGPKTFGCSGSANVGMWNVYFEGPAKAVGDLYFAKEGDWCLTGLNAGGLPGLPLPVPATSPSPSASKSK